jgi:hypothetical protein
MDNVITVPQMLTTALTSSRLGLESWQLEFAFKTTALTIATFAHFTKTARM